MEKLVFLLWGDGSSETGDVVRSVLLGDTVTSLERLGGRGISVNVHDTDAAAAPSPVPTPVGEEPLVAEISVWVDCYDRRGALDQAIEIPGTRMAGYLVTESLYEDYGSTPHAEPRTWSLGTRSPGVLTVSLIHRPTGLDYATWIQRWHEVQSPLSAALQPRCRYVRNEVHRPITQGAPAIDGIVEEAWPSAAHVADPMLFFNAGSDPEVLNTNLSAMLESVESCLDLSRLRNMTMSEYLVTEL